MLKILTGIILPFILLGTANSNGNESSPPTPNIVLMMCDDLGWGDTGFNGNKIIKTPHLDEMATEGVNLTHFYSIGPVCSPTRASFLTGRHHFRMGIQTANVGTLPKQEYTIARMLRSKGYATGHFGKWHLGTLSKTVSSKGPKRKPALNYSPPWERDYDSSFVTESATATWNPAKGPRAKDNPYYENGIVATENLAGCDSRVLMDRAIPFIEKSARSNQPFLAVIWFHAPHEDILAGPEYLAQYEGHGEAAHYYGCVTAVDDQVGRLRAKLEELNLTKNTVVLFTSDNGPEGKAKFDPMKNRRAGVTGGFRGRKRSLHDGGVRVPTLAVWPNHISPGTSIETPLSVLDLLPTISAITKASLLENRPLDGENVLPILLGKNKKRSTSIPFRFRNQASLLQDDYKLIINSQTDQTKDTLFDLSQDRTESSNVISKHPELARELRAKILSFLASAEKSHQGADYGTADYAPTTSWKPLPK